MRIPSFHRFALLMWSGLSWTGVASATDVYFHGKVTLEDGSPPAQAASIQRICLGMDHPIREGLTSSKTGEYMVRLDVSDFGQVVSTGNLYAACKLEASLSGYISSQLDMSDRHLTLNPRLPPIILVPSSQVLHVDPNRGAAVPHAAAAAWETGIKELNSRNWAAAEKALRTVVKQAPQFSPAWSALGSVYQNLGELPEAREALQHAVELDPKPLAPYLALAGLQLDMKDWAAAAATAQTLITADTRSQYLDAHLQLAVARYQLKDWDGALTSINDAIRLDKRGELPRAEYVLGLVLEARHDNEAAIQHMRNYIEHHPRARDVAAVMERIANVGKAPPADLSLQLTPVDLRLAAVGEAPVPGGIQAFSALAHLKSGLTAQDFFLEYCRALSEVSPGGLTPTQEAAGAVVSFTNSVEALEALGESGDEGTLIRVSIASDEQRKKSQNILAVLGWKLATNGYANSLEPTGEDDHLQQEWVLAALGVDELALRQAIEEKRDFEFFIPKGNARLVGGSAWGVILKGRTDIGGPVEVFTRDRRFARVYSGLGAMDEESSMALVTAIGLGNLIVKYSPLVAEYGSSLTVAKQQMAVPGGPNAIPVWAKLSGFNPRNPTPFLRALFDKDQGRLLAFYSDLAGADAAHQHYFTQTTERAEAFYRWYRDSVEAGASHTRWQTAILRKLTLDASGHAVLPGGREAWATAPSQSDEDLLLHGAPLEALVALDALQEERGTPLNLATVQFLAAHYDEWRHLFPYFEKLPGLDADDFHALAGFAGEVAKATPIRRNLLIGEWHSLVALIVLGTQSGALDAAQGAHAFRQVCEGLRTDSPSAKALEAVRALAGDAADVDEALATRLLRLSGARRESFDRVKALQNVPPLATITEPPDATKTLTALSGAVYAALLEPSGLLVAADPQLLRRHNFVPGSQLFAPASLVATNHAPGSNLAGGFANFHEVAGTLNRLTIGQASAASELPPSTGAPLILAAAVAAPAVAAPDGHAVSDAPGPASNGLIFRAGGRLVEVYATITDSRGRYIDDLAADQFSILEDGKPKPVFAFENHNSAVSVALVFDTTGSMARALPPLRSAAMQLIDDLRPSDSVAVYSFNEKVTELQAFTSDKLAAKRAILKTHASGITALYDALVRVNHDLSARPGKKVIIVFTDGGDNASMLTSNIAIESCKAQGIPIFTLAEGDALTNPILIQQLSHLSESTGGTPFRIGQLSDIGGVFAKISQDLLHGYMLDFQTGAGDNHAWRKIEVVLGRKHLQVRAREGYYAE